MRLQTLFHVAATVTAVATTSASHATTWFVSPCGQDAWVGVQSPCLPPLGPKRTIQAAIDVAVNGDTVFVLPGSYFGTIDFDGKAITVLGASAAATTLDGQGNGPVVKCNSLEGPATVLQGLTITGGSADQSGGGMLIALANPTILECVFLDNVATINGGGVACIAASPSFVDCLFEDNGVSGGIHGSGGGLSIMGGLPTIQDCVFTDNYALLRGGGLAITGNASPTISGCTFSLNREATIDDDPTSTDDYMGGAVAIIDSNATFQSCLFDDNYSASRGAVGISDGTVSFTTCTFTDNSAGVFPNGLGGALTIRNDAEVTLFGCSFVGNSGRFDGGAVHVQESQLDASFCGFQTNASEETGGGAISGRDADVTIAACTFTGNTAPFDGGAILGYGVAGSIDLAGATFTNNVAGEYGGAVRLQFGGITIDQCTFNGNTCDLGGGGLTVLGTSGVDGSVTACTFIENTAYNGGGVRFTSGTLDFSDTTFDANEAINVGGGLSASISANVRVHDSVFTNNVSQGGGGGLALTGDGDIVGCQFLGNSAERGGGAMTLNLNGSGVFVGCRFEANTVTDRGSALAVTTGSEAHVINTLVTGNTGPFGSSAIAQTSGDGGIQLDSTLIIVNSSIVDNAGGGVDIDGNPFFSAIYNSIVWDNTSGSAMSGDPPLVQYSNIEGGFAGLGNIDADPLFINPVLGNYRLGDGSPCIDSGLNAALPSDSMDLDDDGDLLEDIPFDFDGSARITSGSGCGGDLVIDMGAFETAGPAIMLDGDVNGDGVVDFTDLLIVLSTWGACPEECCPADLDQNGQVDFTDLLVVLSNWS